jgi:hypothetical protein
MIKSMTSNAVGAAGARDVSTPEPSALRSPLEGSLRFIDTRYAAEILGLSPRTLEKYRVHGGGPTYRKFGGRVLYTLGDLEAWAGLAVRTSTSDPGPPRVIANQTAKPGRSRRAR